MKIDHISKLKKFINVMSSKYALQVIEKCWKKEKNISELSRELKCSKKVLYFKVKDLEKIGVIELENRRNEKYNPVYIIVKHSPFKIKGVIEDLCNLYEEVILGGILR